MFSVTYVNRESWSLRNLDKNSCHQSLRNLDIHQDMNEYNFTLISYPKGNSTPNRSKMHNFQPWNHIHTNKKNTAGFTYLFVYAYVCVRISNNKQRIRRYPLESEEDKKDLWGFWEACREELERVKWCNSLSTKNIFY